MRGRRWTRSDENTGRTWVDYGMHTLAGVVICLTLLCSANFCSAQPTPSNPSPVADPPKLASMPKVTVEKVGAEPLRPLRLTAKVGQRFDYLWTTETIGVETRSGEKDRDMSLPKIEINCSCVVTDISPDGGMRMSVTTGPWRTVSKLADADSQQFVDKSIANATGTRLMLSISSRGPVLAGDATFPTDVPENARRFLNSIITTFAMQCVILPDEAVGAEAKWSLALPTTIATASDRRAVVETWSPTAATISLADQMTLTPRGPVSLRRLPPNAKAVDQGGEGTLNGRYTLLLDSPLPSEMSESTRMIRRTQITTDDKVIEQVSTTEVRHTLRRIDKDQPATADPNQKPAK